MIREFVGGHRWAAVLIGFLGVAIVLRGGGESLAQAPPLVGVAIGLLGALGSASVSVTLRQLNDTEHVAAIVFWFFVATVIIAGLMMPVVGRRHAPGTLAMVAAGGAAGGLAQLLMTASLRAAPVAVVAPFDYLQIIGALLFGWFLLGSRPTLSTVCGAALIAASGLYTLWREHLRRRDRLIQAASAPM